MDSVRMFIALPIPQATAQSLSQAFTQYPQYIEKQLPIEKWHLTLLWMGNVENPKQYYSRLAKPMPQSFVPAVRFIYAGRGLQRQQLWAYADPSMILQNMRAVLIERLRSMRFPFPEHPNRQQFVPHVHMADLFAMAGGVGLADYPLTTAFSPQVIQIIRSELTPEGSRYFVEKEIPLTAVA